MYKTATLQEVLLMTVVAQLLAEIVKTRFW